jgi:hypothetical protein
MDGIESVLGSAIVVLVLLTVTLGVLGLLGLTMRWLCRVWSRSARQ